MNFIQNKKRINLLLVILEIPVKEGFTRNLEGSKKAYYK